MKKKQKTFAERAKAIKEKYSRADWDKIEREDMMKELSDLREEQEEMRAAMGIADGADQMDEQEAMGGRLYAGGGYKFNIPSFGQHNNNDLMKHQTMATDPRFGSFESVPEDVTGDTSFLQPNVSKLNNSLVDASANNKNTLSQKYTNPSNSILPFAISAGASAIGDIVGMANYNKNMPKSVSFSRMAPVNMSLQAQREALTRSNDIARNIMLRNSRDVSSPANAYSNEIAGISSLADSYGTQMGQSYMNEANANQQSALQVGSRNAEIDMQEQMQNTALQSSRAGVNAKYIDSLAQTLPSALRDYRQQVNDTNMINNMGKDYGQYAKYNPNMNAYQKFLQLLFGQNTTTLNRNNTNIIGR